MSKPSTIKAELIKAALLKFPKTSTSSLSKKLYLENPEVFSSPDSVRTLINYYVGKHGDKSRKQIVDRRFIDRPTYVSPLRLPESHAVERKDFVFPKAATKVLILNDTHFPYQINEKIEKAINKGKEAKINTILLNGDIVDLHKASFHEQNPKARSIKEELESVRIFLDYLKENFPGVKIYYKEGNHEARMKRYLSVKAVELYDMEEYQLPILLRLGEKGIEWIPNQQLMRLGKLYIFHGNELKGGGGIDPARTIYLKTGVNAIAGDKHKTKTFVRSLLSNEVIQTFSIGCLCELNPAYLPYCNDWNHGAAIVSILDNEGNFEVDNFRL